jgi:formylglycine-generating enzyme required for sulfatase activity
VVVHTRRDVGAAGGAGEQHTYTRGRHPVTQVAYEDAAAYAAWAGKALPTEAEWEYAARGGLDGKVFAWGDELAPDGQMLVNSWQGEFPWQIIKGGSHLCAPNYCLRFRPAAWQGEAVDTSTGHIGFRCVVRGA